MELELLFHDSPEDLGLGCLETAYPLTATFENCLKVLDWMRELLADLRHIGGVPQVLMRGLRGRVT